MTKKISMLSLLIVLAMKCAFAQMNYWVTPPFKYSMSSSTPVASALYSGAPASGSYRVANGAFDQNGALLFYVQDDRIYKKNGVSIGLLTTSYYGVMGGEIVIVPIPGQCKKFYVIYSINNPVGNAIVAYVTVDCSGTNPVIGYNSGLPFDLGLSGLSASDNLALACGKMNGSGATATYYLYGAGYDPSTGNSVIKQYVISSAGISAGTSVGNLSLNYGDTEATELELSQGGDYLAWSRPSSNKVFVIKLTGSNFQTYVPSSLQTYALTSVKGLEFDNSLVNPMLYVAGGTSASNVFKKIDVASATPSQVSISSTLDWSSTFLEYAKNGKMYGMVPGPSSTHKMAELDLASGVITSQTVNFDSRHNNSFLSGIYTLPDQIDGQDYSYFIGNLPVTINQLTLNGDAMFTCDQSGIPPVYYNCTPLNLNVTYNLGTPVEYRIEIISANNDCEAYYNSYPYSSNVISYYGPWISGAVPANLDLRTLTDGSGNNLGNATGNYRVNVVVKDGCGKVTSVAGLIYVLQGVSPVINLQIFNYTDAQTYLSPSQNINSPINVGSSSLGFRVSASTGNVTQMRIKVEEYNSSGTYLNTVFDQTKNVSNLTSLTYENLNNYCVPSSVWGLNPGYGNCNVVSPSVYSGYSGYFSYSNALFSAGKYYKLTVNLSNPCSSTTNWSYLYVSGVNQRLATTSETSSSEVSLSLLNDIMVYPNPAIDELAIKVKNPSDDSYTVVMYDVSGKVVKVVSDHLVLNKEEQLITVNIQDLANGLYTYKVISNTISKTGKISIVK